MNKTLDLTKYTLEDFKRFSIFELRDIAAFFGVQSPTSHSKSELLLLIDEAKKKPKVILTEAGKIPTESDLARGKKGRPTKPAQNIYIMLNAADENASVKKYDDSESTQTSVADDSVPYEKSNSPYMPKPFDDLIAAKYEAFDNLSKGFAREYVGYLEINPKGYGFLRANPNCVNPSKDAHIDYFLIRRFGLRKGDVVKAVGVKPFDDKAATITYVLSINGEDSERCLMRPNFDNLTAIFPDKRYSLEGESGNADVSSRLIDIIAPIGKGQRALIVSPPKAGKTTLLKDIACNIKRNYPEVKMYILLIDERPEEVTDIQRSIDAEIVYSTFDEDAGKHIIAAEQTLESAKRYVESGMDVVIILDSLTRLARAYNSTVESSGRVLSGGLDPSAISAPKKFFGAARNTEKGGTLTIIATALVETGSKLDDIIYEEFKGTGNSEIVLDRKLAEKRIYPAINVSKSSTRREDLLLNDQELKASHYVRNFVGQDNSQSLEKVIQELKCAHTNAQFVEKFNARMDKITSEGYNFVGKTR